MVFSGPPTPTIRRQHRNISVWRDVAGKSPTHQFHWHHKKPQVYALYNLYGTDTGPISTELIRDGLEWQQQGHDCHAVRRDECSARDLYVWSGCNACYYVAVQWRGCLESLRGGRLAAGGQ